MLQKVIVLTLCGLFALSSAMPFDVLAAPTPGPIDDCRLCEQIVGVAERHHHNNFNKTTQQQLKRELDRECFQFTHTHGHEAARKCVAFINAHIATIYNDVVAGKRPSQVCKDIGACGGVVAMSTPPPPPPSSAPKELPAEELPQHDRCHTCSFVVGRAEHHFKKNETAAQLLKHLDRECKQLAQLQGQAAADECTKLANNNIQVIYNDIKAGKRPHQICAELGECGGTGAPPTGMPVSGGPKVEILAEVLPRHDPCRICEFVMARAEHHLHNGNVTDKNRLLRELEHDCIQLAHSEGDQASVACLNLAQKDIDLIFNDINAGKHPRQICEDVGECTARTGRPMTGMPVTGMPMTTMLSGPSGGPSMMPFSTTASGFLKKIFNMFHH